MKPYSIDDAETDLRAAIDRDDHEAISRLGKVIDDLDVHPAPVSLHSAALYYAEQGIPVFPLTPGTKFPLKGSGGCHDATIDPDLVNAWWEGNPNANIGIATGHLVDVVDIDGFVGQTSRMQNWSMFSSLKVLGQVSTPRPGGLHLYVPRKEGISNGAGLLPKIDYRGLGGYVVAPPSVNEQGTYAWVRPLDLSVLAIPGAA